MPKVTRRRDWPTTESGCERIMLAKAAVADYMLAEGHTISL